MTSPIPIQVLFVVSNDGSRLALQVCLNEIDGLLLAEASSASETLQKLRDGHVDVVLLDLGLRDLDGIDLTRQIRQSHRDVRVLISTASDMPEDIFAALDAGADGYVLNGNLSKSLEMAIRSVRLGAVWLDPGIARQVLEVMVSTSNAGSTRTLPTGIMTMPLKPHEKEILHDVAASNCVDGVCLVDPAFVKKLRRFAPSST